MKAFPPPLFESTLLHDFASAIELRGKAIRHQGAHLKCARAVEDSFERLNVDVSRFDRFNVRLSIWSDGHMWLCVTQPGPRRTGGWAFRHELRSHVAEFDGPEVCERFERTIGSPTEAMRFWPNFSTQSREA